MSPLILFASARREGDTWQAVQAAFPNRPLDVVNLTRAHIHAYDYQEEHEKDAFPATVEQIAAAPLTVFATPIYWASMSGPMKGFLDRFTEILHGAVEVRESLRGRPCCVLACGSAPAQPDGFELPFTTMAEHFGMRYQGCFYWCSFYPATEPHGRQRDAGARRFGDRMLAEATAG